MDSLIIHEEKLQLDPNTMNIIGERSEPLSMVFNDQPRDIYIYSASSLSSTKITDFYLLLFSFADRKEVKLQL